MRAILHRQHSDSSPGVSLDLTGAGVVEAWMREVELIPRYLKPCQFELERMGIDVDYVEGRPYGDHHKWAVTEAQARPGVPVAYIAAHVNSVSNTKPLSWMFYDRRSTGGRALAERMTESMVEAGHRSRDPMACYMADKDAPDAWLRNPQYTLAGIYAGPSWLSAVCCEPLTAQHLQVLGRDGGMARIYEYLEAVGVALAHGIATWLCDRVEGIQT
jgi:hypothetical protein